MSSHELADTAEIMEGRAADTNKVPHALTTCVFPIRLSVGKAWLRSTPNSLRFHGKGQIRFDGECIALTGMRHRLFRPGVAQQINFHRADIANAHTNGKQVRFTQFQQGIAYRAVSFAADSPQDAVAIVAMLPRQRSQAFAQFHAEQKDFHQRMQDLSPRAPVTPAIVALNLIVFIAMCLAGAGFWTPDPAVAIQWGSNYGPLTIGGQWWRLLTATFIHFGLLHVTLNMIVLYQSGRLVERMYGSAHYLTLYLFAGLTGSFASLLWNPGVNSAGASGAVFGVFGGMLAFMGNKRNAVPPSIMSEHLISTGIFVAFNLVNGFTHPGIDNAAHVGGLLGGACAGFLLARPLNLNARNDHGKRIALTLLVAATMSYGLIYHYAHPSEAIRQDVVFQHTLKDFAIREKPLLTEMQNLAKQLQEGQISAFTFCTEIDSKILPRWGTFHRAFEAAKVSPNSKQYLLWQAISRYVDARRMSVQLLTDGIRKRDRILIERAKAETANANAQIDVIRKLQKQ